MSRVIRVEAASRSRQRVLQGMALALRYAASSGATPADQPDLLAFLDLSLAELRRSVDETAAAWEKRGYWLKADQFRQDWRWADRIGDSLHSALDLGDLDRARVSGMELATPVHDVRLPASLVRSRPWVGAWERRNGSSQKPRAT